EINSHYSLRLHNLSFFLLRPPPRSSFFPYTTLFRSRTALSFDLLGKHYLIGSRDPLFWESLYNTLYMLLAIPISLVIALGLAIADRKSTRLNSSHVKISYAVFCLKKK